MTTNNLRQIIFLDPGIPDIADLIDGARPGDQVFVLRADGNGLEQIADILASENLSDLDSIAIVSHGDTGELRLGSALLTDGNLADNSGALAEIGAALAPGGAIQLYGCDVALGAAGQQFIDDFSALTGGATVEAATHLVGDAASGGNFTLDAAASFGAPAAPVPEAAPFTSEALANFQGLLSATPNAQLFFRINQSFDVRLGHINSDGSNVGTVYVGGGNTATAPGGGGLGNETSVAVDPAAGLVFGVGIGNKGSYDAFSVHDLKTGALISTTTFGANTGAALTDDVVQALAIDPFTQTLYVGDWGTTTSNTGIRQFTYNPLNGGLTPLASNGGFAFTSSQISGGITNANALFLDRANNLLYYVDDDTGYNFSPFVATNSVNVINLSTLSRTQLTSNGSGTGQFPVGDQTKNIFIGAHGNIVGLAVDVADGIVYFETTDNKGSGNIGLWRVSASGGTNQTATKVTLPAGVTLSFAGQTNEGGDAAGLSFDPTTDQLYLTNADNDTTTRNVGAIYVMQMNAAGNAVSLLHTFDTATLVGASPATVDPISAPSTTFLDLLPTLGGLSGTAISPVEQGAAVTLLTGAPGVSDPDGNHLASATVQITGGTFTSNENSSSDDHLGVLDGTFKTSGTISGTSITISYNSATETLTLGGYDTLANYQTALGKVQFETTGDNPTNYGSNQTRTLTWQVNDGAVGNPSGPTTGTTSVSITAINDPPALAGVPATAKVTGSTPITLAPAVTVTDPDNLNLASATVSITGGTSDLLAADTTGTAITASYDNINEVLTLSGNDTLADYQAVLDKVTFESPHSGGSRTVSWVLNDGSASNNLSAPQTETLTLACYRRGTRIATDRGEQPIEALTVGDRVMTLAGEAKPIVWVGRRTVNCLAHPRQELVWPVRIEAGAFGNAMPARALDLSPDHAVFCNGALVPVRRLVNGATIRQVAVPTVTYHHIELARHDLLLAEGLPAETYLDTGNRTMFEDEEPAVVLHPDFATGQRGRETGSCAAFVDHPDQVEPIWRSIAERAVAMGWQLPGVEDDPDLRIVVGARCLRPIAAADGRYTFVLPSGDAPARLVSRSARPTLARPWLNDGRCLGVRVRRLTLRRGHDVREVGMDDPALDQGWWAVEWEDHAPCRWTRGDAIVPVIGEGVLEVELAGTMLYPVGTHGWTGEEPPRTVAA